MGWLTAARHFFREHGYSLALSAATTLAGVALFALIHWTPARGWSALRLIDQVEGRTLDMRFRLRGARPVDPRIVIVAIDQQTFQRLGWPFPRSHHARVVERLRHDGARAIGFDVAFSSPDPNSPAAFMRRLAGAADASLRRRLENMAQEQDSDRQFAEAVQRAGNVVLSHTFLFGADAQAEIDPAIAEQYSEILAFQAFPQARKASADPFPLRVDDPESAGRPWEAERVVPNLRLFADAAKSAGFFNFVADSDGVFRRVPLVIAYRESRRQQGAAEGERNFYPPLSVQVLAEYLKAGQDVTVWFNRNGPERVQVGPHVARTDAAGRVLINYGGPERTYPYHSFSEVAEGRVPRGTFRDKIVLVGASAVGIGDIRSTPFQEAGYPGVEIHANVIDNFLAGGFLRRGPAEELADLGVLLVCGAVAGLAFVAMRPAYSWVVLLAAASGLFAFVFVEFQTSHRWLSLVIPAGTLAANYAVVTTYRVIFEEREKRRVRGAFGMYVHPEVVRQMIRNPELLRLGGEETEMTVMFCDVRGFTSISEKLQPSALVELLNGYLTAMTDVIMANWGTVDKYEGDAIMAFWGRPYPLADHAARACGAALEMLEALARLNEKWRREGRQTLQIGIGINSGRMVVGNMGSTHRFNYTVLGDAVNLGARLEGQNKEYGTRILVSESTFEQVRSSFVGRELDLIRVRGKQQPVAVFELLGGDAERARYGPALEVFARGLAAYRQGRFVQALVAFEEVLAAAPEDGPARLFAGRCRHYAANPPAAWDGVFVASAK